MKHAPVLLLLGAAGLAVPERWLHNPRERTAAAIEAWSEGKYAAADRELDAALGLAGETPRALFNSGTGRLGAGTPGAALPLLTQAAERAAGDAKERALRPEAMYNLGNAYLAVGDSAAAAESYRAALRLAPDHAAAKHNLELALQKQRQKEREHQQQRQQGGGGAPQDQGDQRRERDEGQGDEDQQSPEQQQRQQQQQQQQQSPPSDPRRGAGGSPRLPNFQQQRDMSAEQAAALLEAVENLEREQRRAQAERRRAERARVATEKDW